MSFGPSFRFDWQSKLAVARAVLASPPAVPRIVRPTVRGDVVQRFALPLALCPTTNRTRHTRPGQQGRTKELLLGLMQVQARQFRAREPLPGRT